MNERVSSENRKWWSRWDQALLEGLLVLMAVGAVVFGVLAVIDAATADELQTVVSLDDGSATVTPDRSDGYRLDVDGATLSIEDPTVAERFAVATPPVLTALVVGAAATLLRGVARSVRSGEPFQHSNARLLRWASSITLVGGMIASFAASLTSVQLVGDADTALPVETSATLSFWPIPVGIVLAVLAEVFRRGAILRDDVTGLV